MMKELLYYFEGFDESIIKLNDYLSEDGYEFVKYNLNEFEEIFISFFTSEENYKKFGTMSETISSLGIDYKNLSIPFIHGLQTSLLFNHYEIFTNNYIVFLRDKYSTENIEEESHEENSDDNEYWNIDKRLNELVAKFKLFKHGHIKLISSFIIVKEFKWCFSTAYSPPSRFITYSKYSLNGSDLSELKYFSDKLLIPSYIELAFNSFLEYYNVEDEKIKFILLMMCLESIFNVKGIRHIKVTISRHVAVLLSIKKLVDDNKSFFYEKFNKVKELYEFRSEIVHGNENKGGKAKPDEIRNKLLELETIVRDVLQKLIWIHDFDLNKPKSKKELFNYLNAKGFPG